jgi:hypothetical protein
MVPEQGGGPALGQVTILAGLGVHHLPHQFLYGLPLLSGTPRAGLLPQLFGQGSGTLVLQAPEPGIHTLPGYAQPLGYPDEVFPLVQPQETLGPADHPGIPTPPGQVLQFLALAVG